jgi:hypothetical protein
MDNPRRQLARALREQGKSFGHIGAVLGVSRQRAYQLVQIRRKFVRGLDRLESRQSKRGFPCPFCGESLARNPERHVLSCALAEIAKQGSKQELARRIELAARPKIVPA